VKRGFSGQGKKNRNRKGGRWVRNMVLIFLPPYLQPREGEEHYLHDRNAGRLVAFSSLSGG
jgi:hypothetical protein